ncbi:hypothetical protein GVN20_06880 [Runella sp. CRIBMP]|uniref:type IV toxin-antitoxin system AbiEi family antitoxin n=1 Tax=Runella sp. CRIBMP TaxID=2683261 RepID=UPI001412F9F2|nr:type IV toxin-antitoxin system AbiEi family antitoxin [Runella sp. CRIBMP]NBB19073.1 hypothetical protein [Runella sp. CRIBMP]
MRESEIAHKALENLHKNLGITGHWEETTSSQTPDGTIELIVGNHSLKFHVEIKQELRNHQLPKLIEQAQRDGSLMVVANRIFPKIKEELRLNKIAHLETNGNIWINQSGVLLWVDTQKALPEMKEKGNRAFTKTGLKVVFDFLLQENEINLPYREIAKNADVSLGNVNYVFAGLKEMGFLIKLNKDRYKLINKKELLDKWVTAYAEKLKPSLRVGTFRFLKAEDFYEWKKLPVQLGKTCWGSEPAGDLLTNYLRPEQLTLYTLESRNELMKNYRLIPDDKGNVQVYKVFWKTIENQGNTAPALLVYTDLMNIDDSRAVETAQKIYDEYIQPQL